MQVVSESTILNPQLLDGHSDFGQGAIGDCFQIYKEMMFETEGNHLDTLLLLRSS